jgi:hypothetical protein
MSAHQQQQQQKPLLRAMILVRFSLRSVAVVLSLLLICTVGLFCSMFTDVFLIFTVWSQRSSGILVVFFLVSVSPPADGGLLELFQAPLSFSDDLL